MKIKMKYTPTKISELKPNEIFVFGSNENGNHFGGAARIAYEKFGAKWGKANGRSGQTYAIPTLDRDMEKVEPEMLQIYIEDFIQYVREHPKLTFYLTKIGCGIAGWEVNEVKDLLWGVLGWGLPKNLIIPQEFMRHAEDFSYVDGTIFRDMNDNIGQMSVEEAPYEIERLNNQERVEWRMDFHKFLESLDDYNVSRATLSPGYCWVVCDK